MTAAPNNLHHFSGPCRADNHVICARTWCRCRCHAAARYRPPSTRRRPPKVDLLKRALSQVVTNEAGCWMLSLHPGHRYPTIGGKPRKKGHRFVYELLVGPIPDGLTLDHLCRMTACVNPAHLEPVTMRENILRGSGPSALNARKTHCPNGHPYEGSNLVVDSRGARRCRVCDNAKGRARRRAAAAVEVSTGRGTLR